MTEQHALVIGGNGGIASAVLRELEQSGQFTTLHCVLRRTPQNPSAIVQYHTLSEHSEQAVSTLCAQLKSVGHFSTVICCIGALHGEQRGVALRPEKRLEDISVDALDTYFHINSVVPALWLKCLLPLVKSKTPAKVAFVSARVGSISDNRLGGWYGYRASKAALNMLIKTAQVEYKRRAPNVAMLSYHPGTVDTPLSEPFQQNVPNDKLFTPQFTARQLLGLLPGLTADEAPYYLDWQGKSIGW